MDGKMLVALACCLALLQIAEGTVTVTTTTLVLGLGKRQITAKIIASAPASGTIFCAAGTGGATASYTFSPSSGTAVAIATGCTVTRTSMPTTPGTETISVVVTNGGDATDTATASITVTLDTNPYWSVEGGDLICIDGAVTAGAVIGSTSLVQATGGLAATSNAITGTGNADFTMAANGAVTSVNAISATDTFGYMLTITATPNGAGGATGASTLFILKHTTCQLQCSSAASAMISATLTIILAAVFNLFMKQL